MNCMEMVGSEIFWNWIGTGFSGEQSVSPMEISEIPEIATIEPMPGFFYFHFIQTVKFI